MSATRERSRAGRAAARTVAVAVLACGGLLAGAGAAYADNCDLRINPLDCQNTAWVVGSAAAAAAAAAAASVAAQQNKPRETVAITEPAHDAVVAVTNARLVTPQAQPLADPNERRPASRTIKVRGTATNTATVVVNGQSVPVTGGTWEIQLPVTVGPMPVTATTPSGQQATATVHVIEIVVDSPTENQAIGMATQPPARSAVSAQAHVAGHPTPATVAALTFRWELHIGGHFRTRNGTERWDPYLVTLTGQSTAPAAWSVPFTETTGGWARLVATAQVPGVLDGPDVRSDPRWFDLRGTNPSRADVTAFIRAEAGADADVVIQIMCHESLRHSFLQFRQAHEGREPADQRIPADLRTQLLLRPVFGAPPAGIGISQADPAAFPAEHWDWQANVRAGIRIFREKSQQAGRLAASERQRLDAERAAAQAVVDRERRARGITTAQPATRPVTVPALTPAQLRRETIRRYNGGRNFRFDAHFVLGADSLHIRLEGTGAWVEDPGTWEGTGAWQARGGPRVQRNWVPVAPARLGYVDAVEQCR